MTYLVKVSGPAENDIDSTIAYIFLHSPQNAAAWFDGVEKAIFSLETMPYRCPISPHSETLRREVRSLLYERHLIFFMINEAEKEITVLRVWPGARDTAQKEDLEKGIDK